MGFQLIDYDLLSQYIRESIATELQSHGINKKNLNKALNALAVNHPERAIQCKYLLIVLDCLDKSESKDKQILNAAAYYIREQIKESYQGTLTPFFVSPIRSTLFNSLTTSLDLTVENFPGPKDLLNMYISLCKFMQLHTYHDADPIKGYLERDKQLFASEKISGYKVEEVLQDLVIKIADLELKQIELTKTKHLEKALEKKSGPHSLGLFSASLVSAKPSVYPEPVKLMPS